jgi:hypothetical protein
MIIFLVALKIKKRHNLIRYLLHTRFMHNFLTNIFSHRQLTKWWMRIATCSCMIVLCITNVSNKSSFVLAFNYQREETIIDLRCLVLSLFTLCFVQFSLSIAGKINDVRKVDFLIVFDAKFNDSLVFTVSVFLKNNQKST